MSVCVRYDCDTHTSHSQDVSRVSPYRFSQAYVEFNDDAGRDPPSHFCL